MVILLWVLCAAFAVAGVGVLAARGRVLGLILVGLAGLCGWLALQVADGADVGWWVWLLVAPFALLVLLAVVMTARGASAERRGRWVALLPVTFTSGPAAGASGTIYERADGLWEVSPTASTGLVGPPPAPAHLLFDGFARLPDGRLELVSSPGGPGNAVVDSEPHLRAFIAASAAWEPLPDLTSGPSS